MVSCKRPWLRSAPGVHSCFHRHAWPQPGIERIIGIRSDTHRNPLRHFHEIAGRIAGFDDGKFVACRRSDPFDLAVNVRSLKRIDSNDNRLSRRDARRLGLLEVGGYPDHRRSEEHTSELQSLMRISYAVFCLKKKKTV